MLDIFDNIGRMEHKYVYMYVVMLILLVVYFKHMNIGTNIVVGLAIGVIAISYHSYRTKTNTEIRAKQLDDKRNTIRPKPEHIYKYDNMVDYLYSIQDLYAYNPPAYEEMIDHLDDFIVLYEEGKTVPAYAGRNLNEMMHFKHSAINALHSIIYNTPDSKEVVNKLNAAIDQLEILIDEYMNELYEIYNEYHKSTGLRNSSVIVDISGVQPRNFYYTNEQIHRGYIL